MTSQECFKRLLTPSERLFLDIFFNNVVVLARVKGDVSPDSIELALHSLQQRHIMLRTVIDHSGDGACFVEKCDTRLPCQTQVLASDGAWIQKCIEEQQIPFNYTKQPPIRFFHFHSPSESEIMILCQHAICDGKSLVYLLRDLLTLLGTPNTHLDPLPIPPAMGFDKSTFPVKLSHIERIIAAFINRKWRKEKVVFDDTDLKEVQKTFWQQNQYKIRPWILPPDQTTRFVAKCNAERVTVNTALINSILAAHSDVQGTSQPYFSNIAMAVAMRDRVHPPIGDHFGLYTTGIDFKYKFQSSAGFWVNAKALHNVIQKSLTDRLIFRRLKLNCMLDPSLFDGLAYKKLGMFIQPNQTRYLKIHKFEAKHDIVTRLMKMAHMAGIGFNFVVTNLGHLNIPTQYGPLKLDRLYFIPPPSVNSEKTLGAATIGNNLCLNFSHFEPIYSCDLMQQLQQRMMEHLATAVGW